ncbi:MAG: O-antigen ligase family protein [Gammaproteobacteria bacterium]|nr:O-antigen ligase family protein [Gammaproteobacteria bacterium]
MHYRTISEQADRAARWLAVALGFAIPISTAMDGVLLVLILALWLAGAGFREKFASIRHHPVALAVLALFAMIAVGGLYGSGPMSETINYGGKYIDLLFLVLLIPLFGDLRIRRYGLNAFIAAMLLTLALSYLLALRLLPPSSWIWGKPTDAAIFKDHITQNILMAYLAYLCAIRARSAATRGARNTWIILAVLAVYDVLFLVQGRSGYLALGVLVLYFAYDWTGWRGLAIAAVSTLMIGGIGYLASATLHRRVDGVIRHVRGWRHGHDLHTSIGLRMSFLPNSLAIIRRHPVFGVGTGGFVQAYARQIRGTDSPMTDNPHNQYLLIMIELGVVGLVLLLNLFYAQWRAAADLTPDDRRLARALVLTFASGCLVNSLLIDNTERLFYMWLGALLYAGWKARPQPPHSGAA